MVWGIIAWGIIAWGIDVGGVRAGFMTMMRYQYGEIQNSEIQMTGLGGMAVSLDA